jgi:GTP-binding protein Era
MFKSGFVTIVGRPNVGKSTLMNNMIGEKISIISDKPQTTRNKIQTVYTDEQAQIIFLDTPGIHKPKNHLGDFMNNEVNDSLNEVDVIIMMTDECSKIGPGDDYILEKIKGAKAKKILAINKIDKHPKENMLEVKRQFEEYDIFDEVLLISAMTDVGVKGLVEKIKEYLSSCPLHFPLQYLIRINYILY